MSQTDSDVDTDVHRTVKIILTQLIKISQKSGVDEHEDDYAELGTVNLFLILWFWPSFIVSKFSYLCTRIAAFLLAKPNPFKSNVHNEIEQFSISASLIQF